MTGARAATLTDVDQVADVLVRAFADDPLMAYLFQTDEGRRKKSRLFFVSDAKRAIGKAKGRVDTTDDGEAKGGAIWFAPEQWRTGGMELLGQLPMLFHMGRETPRALSVLGQVEKVHPKQPHWYLAVLGTDPDHQGKGIGSALLAPVLAKCDEEGIPAYLESSKERNIPFYRRHGFEVTTELNLKNGPSLWPMWRDPRPPDGTG
jgi:ribosomal protein S18 acetylase RimI-like enzyme